MKDTRADMSVTLEEGLALYDAAEKKALRRLDASGLQLREEPPLQQDGTYYNGRIPLNLSGMTPAAIAEYYGLQIEFTDYVESQIVLARAEMNSAAEKLDLTRAAVRRTKTGTAQQRGDLALIDVRYVQINADYNEARTYYELMLSIGEAARRDAKFISRIIETKKLELGFVGREGNMGRIQGGAQRAFTHPRRRRAREDE